MCSRTTLSKYETVPCRVANGTVMESSKGMIGLCIANSERAEAPSRRCTVRGRGRPTLYGSLLGSSSLTGVLSGSSFGSPPSSKERLSGSAVAISEVVSRVMFGSVKSTAWSSSTAVGSSSVYRFVDCPRTKRLTLTRRLRP